MIQAYIWIVVFGGLLSTFLSLFAYWKIKNAPGGKYFIVSTFLSAVFTFSYGFELASKNLQEVLFWLRIEYLALPYLPVFILLMCFSYVGRRLSRLAYTVLFLMPLSTIIMNYTNNYHHLYYKSVGLREGTPFVIANLEGGIWFYVYSAFLYSCIAISVTVLLLHLKKVNRSFRGQVFTMVIGLLTPSIASVFYMSGLSPHGIDLGPVFMSVSFIFHGMALIPFQMFNVSPIARGIVFESLEDGVIVTNHHGAIVDYNAAVKKVIPQLQASSIGKPLSEVLVGEPALWNLVEKEIEKDYESTLEGQPYHYRIRFSVVRNKKNIQIGNIITFVDISERVRLEEKLTQLACVDGLTQIYNRTYFLEKSEESLTSLCKNGGHFSVVMFDIDHFKHVNDTYGHEAGDKVITQVVQVAQQHLKSTDIFGRYGGEEFIISMPHTTFEESYEISNRICTEIRENVILLDNNPIVVTASFGISYSYVGKLEDKHSIYPLMQEADKALYLAKRNGRNQVQSLQQSTKSL